MQLQYFLIYSMEIMNKLKPWNVIILVLLFTSSSNCTSQILGSCGFEGTDWLCGYQQEAVRDDFDWSRHNASDGNHYIMVDTASHPVDTTARLMTPEIKLQDTHCFTFQAYVGERRAYAVTNSTPASLTLGRTSQLQVHLFDKEDDATMQPVWKSDDLRRNGWTAIQLALNPRVYQIVFEAVILDPSPGMIAVDNVSVSTSACDSTPHFLRLGDKETNAGRNETLQCLLWGHSGPDTRVVMQKRTGEILLPSSNKIYSNHMSSVFRFSNVSVAQSGRYRCLSGNSTHLGVSNYAHFSVRVPPRPKRGPKVVTPGATHFVIQLRSEPFSGDGPVVQTILYYRPAYGSWTDVHHITSSRYNLWNLQPDTVYELTVTLVRPGLGGAGPPSPKLRKKTKCGLPKSPVQNLNSVSDDPDSITVQWDKPDFSITQCHNYAFIVKYRLSVANETESGPTAYKSKRVKNNNIAVIRGLRAFTTYKFKVETTNSAGSKETEEITARTAEDAPGPIPDASFVTTVVNATAIGLKWDEPLQKNGVLRGYEVSYLGESSFDPNFVFQNDQGYLQLAASERKLVLSSLHPGTNYLISIRAKTKAGLGERTNIVTRTDIAAPTMPRYPAVDANDTAITPTTIEITIIPAQSNGAPITNYYVIVEDLTVKTNDNVAPMTSRAKSRKSSSSRKGRGRKKKKSRTQRSVTLLSFLSRDKRQAVVDVKDDQPNACYRTPLSYREAQNTNSTSYTPARFDPEEITREIKFVVGEASSSSNDELSNPPLNPNKDYNIYVRVESAFDGKMTINCALVAKKNRLVTTVPPPTTTNSTDVSGGYNPPGVVNKSENDQTMMYAGIGAAVLGVFLITIIIILVIWSKRRRKGTAKHKAADPFEVRMMMSDVNSPAHTLLPSSQSASASGSGERQSLMPDVVGYEHQDFLEKASDNGGAGYATSNDERFAVRVDDFHVHVAQMKASEGYGFREEFSAFPDGNTAPCLVADSAQNRSKNRYGNVMAYDHSRVVLEPQPGHEEAFESDYINASYINGYKTPSMYIATQAPTPETSADFWWMVWQEKTNVIVMVTNLVEMGKRKCHKYWPEDKETYGTVDVSLSNVEQLSDYVVRSFVLQQAEGYDVREVKQFHFTAWPDHGVPVRPTNLLTFIRKIKNHEPQGQGPTVVHCSAGSGRTGCFIVVDMMLDMARDEDIVDISNTVRDLRMKRVNMVQNEEQYIFIHEAVLEALLCGETSVMAEALTQHYDDLITVDPQTHFAPIQEEFETLNVITPKLSSDECSVARLPRNRGNNRFMDVLPADRHLAYLVTPDPSDRENNYVNAVYVDSYSTKNTFLVTQMSLPNTVIDMWRLIHDHNCTSIVMMNDASEHDQSCTQYWPDKGSAVFGSFTVELLTQDDEIDVITRLFKLQNVANPTEYRLIQQFQLTNWPAAQPVPYSRNSVLRIIQLISKWHADCMRNGEKGRILVHCVAGAGRSGTFISCYNMCEQLRHEYAVDVFNIVQRLRNVRPQLVETLEQYRFCYEVGIEFTER